METFNKHTTVRVLENRKYMSPRAWGVCRQAGVTLGEILKYYYQHKTFIKLKNCGMGTDQELITFCKQYQHLLSEQEAVEYVVVDERLLKLRHLSKEQFMILNQLFNAEMNRLSMRAQNAFRAVLPPNYTFVEFYDRFIGVNGGSFLNVRNAGVATKVEMERMTSKLERLIDQISTKA